MKIVGGCASDIGRVRDVNQDGILLRCIKQRGNYLVVGAVCDGIGGLERGELASSMIVWEIGNWFDSVESWVRLASVDAGTLFSHLKDQAEAWNKKLFEYRIANDLRTGTTMSLLMLVRDEWYIVHIGDSRIYLYRDGLEQLTADECVMRFSAGKTKKYLDNYMGKNEELSFQQAHGKVRQGDLFVYCTDGIYHRMGEADVKQLRDKISRKRDASEACRSMIADMINRGEADNLSVGGIYVV